MPFGYAAPTAAADTGSPNLLTTGLCLSAMNPEELDTRMRQRERFRSLRIDADAWTIIRLDGRAFTRFTARRFAKPFDDRLRDHMVTAATAMLTDFQGRYAHSFSDEISVLFLPGWEMFDGRVEKLVSVSAGLVSAAFTASCGEAAHFDSRIWQSAQAAEVLDYFRWRQADAARCALNAWCYWTLRKRDVDTEQAVELLANRDRQQQQALLQQYGIDHRQIPLWQRRGVGLRWESYDKPGYDPLQQRPVQAQRRRIRVELELPGGDDYSRYLQDLLGDDG
jgi:tRNA(His) guanylyltransferase